MTCHVLRHIHLLCMSPNANFYCDCQKLPYHAWSQNKSIFLIVPVLGGMSLGHLSAAMKFIVRKFRLCPLSFIFDIFCVDLASSRAPGASGLELLNRLQGHSRPQQPPADPIVELLGSITRDSHGSSQNIAPIGPHTSQQQQQKHRLNIVSAFSANG